LTERPICILYSVLVTQIATAIHSVEDSRTNAKQ
jgi:hypothetical protein